MGFVLFWITELQYWHVNIKIIYNHNKLQEYVNRDSIINVFKIYSFEHY